MKYYTLFFVINAIFFTIYRYVGVDLNIVILFGIFDFIYLFCIYVWKNQPELCNKMMNNCKSASLKPVILNSHNKSSNVTGNVYNNYNSYNHSMKRNVSETVKKYVASNQRWTCRLCLKMLDGSYEIDHIVPLYKGGGNGYENLMALCRNCHGKKTINDKLNLNTNASGNPNYQSYNLNNNYKNPISVNDKGEIYKKILIQKT